MVSGTDEHGTPVMVAADASGESPRETADRLQRVHPRGPPRRSGSRTTSSLGRRPETTIASRRTCSGRCTRRASSSSARRSARSPPPPDTRCPIAISRARARSAAFPSARGDQCDNCGNQLDPIDLIDPRSQDRRHAAGLQEDEAPLSRSAGVQGAAHANGSRDRTVGGRTSGASRSTSSRSSSRARSRVTSTGVFRFRSPGYEERDDKRIYVWFDAVIGYLSASIEWAEQRGTPDAWREWWQNADAEHTYFMGKDNIVFHTVIWPSMLLGYGAGATYGAGTRRPEAPGQRRLERVPDDGGEEVQRESRRADPRARLPRALRPRRAALLPDDRRPGDAGHRLHVGRVRAPEQRRARRHWGNLVNRTLTSAYKNFGAVPTPGVADGATTKPCSDEVESGFDSVGGSDRGRALPRRTPGGDAARRRSATNTSPSRRPGRSSRPTASAPGRFSTSRCASSTV